MNLNYSGQETIAASHDKVWSFINDPASIASCMPDVLESTVIDPHTFDATVQVAVGPVRGKFKFHVKLDPQPGEKRLNMTIGGGGFGSVVDLTAGADISTEGDTTTLDWTGVASMRGPGRHRRRPRSRRPAKARDHDDLRQRQGQADRGRVRPRVDFFARLAELGRERIPFAIATVVARRPPVSSHVGDPRADFGQRHNGRLRRRCLLARDRAARRRCVRCERGAAPAAHPPR